MKKSKPEIMFFFKDVKATGYIVKQKRVIKSWLLDICRHEKKGLSALSFIFGTDDYLLEMNQQYLKHDYYTDVITFDYSEGKVVSGDIFISIDRVKENAKTQKVSYEEELMRVMAHGLLHLCGYSDKTKETMLEMREKETRYLLMHLKEILKTPIPNA